MEFRQIDHDIETLFTEYISEWYQNDEVVVPWATDVKKHGGFNEMLKMHKEAINPVNEAFVPAKTFVLIEDNEIKGAVNIRYELNAFLEEKGGHVGYGVRLSQRGKGFATKLLGFALKELRKENVHEALITCDDDNLGSAKVIEKNGGVEADPHISKENSITRRYWIKLI